MTCRVPVQRKFIAREPTMPQGGGSLMVVEGSNEIAMTHVDRFLVQGGIICSGVPARSVADLSYAERL
jgi:hypothetical protein